MTVSIANIVMITMSVLKTRTIAIAITSFLLYDKPEKTTKWMELFNLKKLVAMTLRAYNEAFVVYLASILGSILKSKNIHPFCQRQITLLDFKKILRQSYPSTPTLIIILLTW